MVEQALVCDTPTATMPSAAMDEPPDGKTRRGRSYRDMLKSTALIGGSSVINVCIGMLRTKIMALLLDPAGYGVLGAFIQIGELGRTVAQMGINASGVRQIAEAVASQDQQRAAVTITVLRRVSLLCGLLGAALVGVLAGPISVLTFGNHRYETAIELLGVATFLSVIAGGQSALLQGMRRIGDLARLAVIGGVMGTAISIPMVYFLGTDGLAPSLVIVAAATLFASWWFCRRIEVRAPQMTLRDAARESASLLKLGFAFMGSGLIMTGASYLVRTIVMRKSGLDAAGAYYAAWTLGGLYLGFVLQALATDFYPRLVGVVHDNDECNRLVNEQAHVSMLLAIPGILFTLTIASLAVKVFYSAKFGPAVTALQWICLGMAVRVLSWPIGYIVAAKNRQAIFFTLEVVWAAINVSLTWWSVEAFGVSGAGMAFLGANLVHLLIVYPTVNRMTGFRWTAVNRKTALLFLAALAVAFTGLQLLPPVQAMALGLVATVASCVYSVDALLHLVSSEALPAGLARRFRNWRNSK